MGGAIFVQEGGKLTLGANVNINRGSVAAGSGGGAKACGSGIFLAGSGTLSLKEGANNQIYSDAIVDQFGVSGTGGKWNLVKSGEGTVELRGANAFSGGTLVSGGILRGDSQGLQGNIVNNTSVVFDETRRGIYAGIMSGTGIVTKTGSGDVTFTGNNTYTGATRVTGGVLRIGTGDANFGAPGNAITLSGGSVGTSANYTSTGHDPIARNLILEGRGGIDIQGEAPGLAGQNTVTWGGAISGPGQFVKSGAGGLILAGANSYTGGTMVTGGVLFYRTEKVMDQWSAANQPLILDGGLIGPTPGAQGPQTRISHDIALGAHEGGIYAPFGDVHVAGVISGPGQFRTEGNYGKITLTGKNTYAGGTLVGDANTLNITAVENLGAQGGAVSLGVQFNFKRA